MSSQKYDFYVEISIFSLLSDIPAQFDVSGALWGETVVDCFPFLIMDIFLKTFMQLKYLRSLWRDDMESDRWLKL